jgi:hypothetical protein
LGGICDRYLERVSQGRYRNVGAWLDAKDNLEERRRMGWRMVKLLEGGNTGGLEEPE